MPVEDLISIRLYSSRSKTRTVWRYHRGN